MLYEVITIDTRIPAADDFDITAFLSRHTQRDELQVEDLSISFGGLHAVSHVSFTAAAGRITSVITSYSIHYTKLYD